jgi:hypothetical protein
LHRIGVSYFYPGIWWVLHASSDISSAASLNEKRIMEPQSRQLIEIWFSLVIMFCPSLEVGPVVGEWNKNSVLG